MAHTYTDEAGNRYEATYQPETGRWHTGYEDAGGAWHDVPPNQMPLKAFTDEQLEDLRYSDSASLSPQQREAVDEELHERGVASGEIHTYTDESGNRYEATYNPEMGSWRSGYEDAGGVWHDVPPNQMPLEAFTDEQLEDLKYSDSAGLSSSQQEAVDEELHERAVSPPTGQHPEAEAPAQPIPPAGSPSSPTLEDLGIQEHYAEDYYLNIPDLVEEPAPPVPEVMQALDPALFDPLASGPTLDPALLDPTAPGATLDPALLDPTAPGETIDPALLDPMAHGSTLDPYLLEQSVVEPGGVADPYLPAYPADPGLAEPYTADQNVQDQGFEDY